MKFFSDSISKHRYHEKDSGSTSLQILFLQESIEKEKIHLSKNRKDIPTQRALLKKIARVKNLFSYLKKSDPGKYSQMSKKNKKTS
jgi:small subunit ribosomal protein S15